MKLVLEYVALFLMFLLSASSQELSLHVVMLFCRAKCWGTWMDTPKNSSGGFVKVRNHTTGPRLGQWLWKSCPLPLGFTPIKLMRSVWKFKFLQASFFLFFLSHTTTRAKQRHDNGPYIADRKRQLTPPAAYIDAIRPLWLPCLKVWLKLRQR